MPVSFSYIHQVDALQHSLVRMGELAGRMMGDAVAAIVARDSVLAHDVIKRDCEMDSLEDEHEEHIIQVMALHQPVARDLRELVAYMRVNTSIERAGDLCLNIAHTAIRLADKPEIRPFVDIPRSYELVRKMWDDAIRTFAAMDVEAAEELRERDDLVDRANSDTIVQLIQISTDSPQQVYQATNIMGVSKALERIADLSVDIADEVVFACRGELRHARTARHQKKTA